MSARRWSFSGLDHIALRVREPSRSARFYATLLNAEFKQSETALIANPGSIPTEHYWVGSSSGYIAFSGTRFNGAAGLDHYCLRGYFDPTTITRQFVRAYGNFRAPEGDWNVWADPIWALWARDCSGNIFHLCGEPGGFWPLLDRLAVQSDNIPPNIAGGEIEIPFVFRHLFLHSLEMTDDTAYYERMLGPPRRDDKATIFQAGQCQLVLHLESPKEIIHLSVLHRDLTEVSVTAHKLGARATRVEGEQLRIIDPDGLALIITLD